MKHYPIEKLLAKKGLSFDDVLIAPLYSEILPSQTDLKTRLSRNIELNIPLLSAAMDSVTESKTAITMALEGGIGIIHKNMAIREQAEEVKKVKRFENGFIKDPITVTPDILIAELHELTKKYGFSTFPVVDGRKRLCGLITDNDYDPEAHASMKICERMIPRDELITAREGVSLSKANRILIDSRHSTLLVVKKGNILDSIVTKKDIRINKEYPNACKDANKRLRAGAAVGPGQMERVEELCRAGADVIVIDTAHGHSKNMIEFVEAVKGCYSDIDVIAGNIATAQAAADLYKAGADAIKIGIGPGSICTTRIVTGVGVPQITAIMQCVKALEDNIPAIADGGIKFSGDIAKAIAAGAKSVMIGSLFAGTDEAPGEMIIFQGKAYKEYRGMGSEAAMKKGSADRYGQADAKKFVPEGIEGRVPYRGPLSENIFQMIGGLKSSMGYAGCPTINDFRLRTKFMEITAGGMRESHPHDVVITKDAPNYQKIG